MSELLTIRPVAPADWPAIETLFGANGACGGCWCMYWRVDSTGRAFEDAKGDPNRRAFKSLVESGRATGVLAFANGTPVGWASAGPRQDFAFLRRAQKLAQPESEQIWSVTCFYVPAAWRRRGVASAVLRGAIDLTRSVGARFLEGYAAVPTGAKPIPAAFAHTGVPRLFEHAGFAHHATVGARAIYRFDHAAERASRR